MRNNEGLRAGDGQPGEKGSHAEDRRPGERCAEPNAETREAIAELESGKGKRFTSVEALMADLLAGD